jgi:hypothetical protein
MKQVAVHSAAVLKVPAGKGVPVKLEYKYAGEQINIEDFTDTHYVQSMTAFQLPSSAVVKSFKLEKPFVLNTKNEWKGFNFDYHITVEKKKTAMIIYHINLRVDKKSFVARVRFGTKFNKKSLTSFDTLDFAHCHGYVIKVLKEGEYTIDIDYKSSADNTFSPENTELDGEVVSMQVILLD